MFGTSISIRYSTTIEYPYDFRMEISSFLRKKKTIGHAINNEEALN
jgi:hypothetical protein